MIGTTARFAIDNMVGRVVRLFRLALETGFALAPGAAVMYLALYQNPGLLFHDFAFHEIAIAAATLIGLFVAWVTWQCYQASGEPFLRQMALAFLGFTLVYAPHGLLTRLADDHLWLFILFGPVSRLVMAVLLISALNRYGQPVDPPRERDKPALLVKAWLAFLAIAAATTVLALSPWAGELAVRATIEGLAASLCILVALRLLIGGLRSPFMWYVLVAVALFAQSSIAFLLAKPWNHLWWLAHAVFAGGFFVLSYGVIRAYQSTKSFAHVHVPEEMMAQVAASEAAARTHKAAEDRLRGILNSSPIAVAAVSAEGETLFHNPAFAGLFDSGHPEREFRGLAPIAVRRLAEATDPVRDREIELPDRRGGPNRWVLASSLPILLGERTAVMVWFYDITRRKQAEAEIDAARQQAELANRSKSDFLATMSHELRTPLNAILGFAGAMRSEVLGPLGNPRYREYLEDIERSGAHLLALIADILDISAIESGNVRLLEGEVNLRDTVEATLRLVRPRAEAKNIKLTLVALEPPLPRLRGDERRIKQILLNLLGNAIKFTPPNGEVRIGGAHRPDGGLDLWITDTGMGMTAEDIVVALRPFGRPSGHIARDHEGIGLGLPLAKSLVELHGARLHIDSRPGLGTRVTVSFPNQRTVSAAAQ